MNRGKLQSAPSTRYQHGLTLFELTVYILVVAIIFTYALNRFRDYPAEAERASFQAVLMQMRAAINISMMNAIADGSFNNGGEADGSNPMDLMLEVPYNYLGAFAAADEDSLPRRSWYFDSQAGHLVYLANATEHLYRLSDAGEWIPADAVRFQVRSRYAVAEAESANADDREQKPARRWNGVVLEPVFAYRWQENTNEVREMDD